MGRTNRTNDRAPWLYLLEPCLSVVQNPVVWSISTLPEWHLPGAVKVRKSRSNSKVHLAVCFSHPEQKIRRKRTHLVSQSGGSRARNTKCTYFCHGNSFSHLRNTLPMLNFYIFCFLWINFFQIKRPPCRRNKIWNHLPSLRLGLIYVPVCCTHF
jgi:hypothetical protein